MYIYIYIAPVVLLLSLEIRIKNHFCYCLSRPVEKNNTVYKIVCVQVEVTALKMKTCVHVGVTSPEMKFKKNDLKLLPLK